MNPELINLLELLAQPQQSGRVLNSLDHFATFRQIMELAPIRTSEILLPLLYRSPKALPVDLSNHFQLSPLFFIDRPNKLLLKSGRQVGKSYQLALLLLTMAIINPRFNILAVTPLQEQVRRFSTNYVRPLIDSSPFKQLFDRRNRPSMDVRELNNGSRLTFSFAFLSPDRNRGIAADMVAFDEIQDINGDFIPVIESTLDASNWRMIQYSGTPKSKDNTIQVLWEDSSQAEWFIPCEHCNEWNIPSAEYHVTDMIGPYHSEISEEIPGVVCHKCKKAIYPRRGRWVHRFPERKVNFAGYHLPQLILPQHYANPRNWQLMLERQKEYTEGQFHNEILGESTDVGLKLVSVEDIHKAGSLDWDNTPDNPSPKIAQRLKSYMYTAIAADWGGGGDKLTSFTVLALLGILPDGHIDVLWGKRLMAGHDHIGEAKECRHWLQHFNAHFFIHDFSGAGDLRETNLRAQGVPANRIMPINYVQSPRYSLMYYHKAPDAATRSFYNLDRTRSLLYTTHALKLGWLRFFKCDSYLGLIHSKDRQKQIAGKGSLMEDFLALTEEKMSTSNGIEMYRINTPINKTDDFAQAVNYGAMGLWCKTQKWPPFIRKQDLVQNKMNPYDTMRY